MKKSSNMNNYNHPYHLVTNSPWPLLTGMSLLIMLTGAILMFYDSKYIMFFWGFLNTIFCSTMWWRDVIRESTFQGCHPQKIIKMLKMGMLLFIISEIFVFTIKY